MFINRFQMLWDRQAEWSDRVFGKGYRLSGVINHIRKELVEIEESPGSLEEWGDAFGLLCDGARRQGFTADDVLRQWGEKLAINNKRNWGEPDENGTVEHIRDDESPPASQQ